MLATKMSVTFCFLLMLTTVMLPTEAKTVAGRTACTQHTSCDTPGAKYCCQNSDCCGGSEHFCASFGQCMRSF
uniref:Teretoxin Tan11.1 n=1 Tax=Terebra anilis TaxID=553697 RepID=TB1_TERAN|nr:RecName: Full=Teretoxin Tan11.1; Flags: Precursor [Terebra anilis]